MAMKLPKMGIQEMMKDGHKILEEAVYRNIQAVKELSQVTRTSLGPNGKNKMIINYLDKLFVTNDAATILREMEIIHPACKVLVLSSEQQQKEVGDSTNFVIVFGGELLQKADGLLRMGLTQSEISDGFNKACKKALEELQDIVVKKVEDLKNREELTQAIKSVIASKQYGYEDFLAPLVAEASLSVLPQNPKNFNVDNVRVVKILGGTLTDSKVVKGMVFGREPEGIVTRAEKAKIAVFSCPIDNAKTETKGTVLIKNSDELKAFSKDEEQRLEQSIKAIADTGVKVVVTGSAIGEMALHFLNRYNLLALKVLSKFDLRRLCKATNATALARLGAPIAEEIGTCDIVETIEIGSDRVTVFRQESEESAMSTIVVRGATQNMMDDIERAVDDGVNLVKSLGRDNRLLPGAGAVELELSRRIQTFGQKSPGLDQYAIKKFGEAFEVIPRTLCENAGLDATDVISQLYAGHQAGNVSIGVDVENEDKGVCDINVKQIYDSYISKYWAIKFANDAAMTILKVDQIIMSKVAGGPKPKDNPNWDED
jgi:T-complex protein 1 subunit theta